MPEIFKAYDIRGIYPDQLNKNISYKIGRSYAILIQKENPNKKLNIVVGSDMRLSSPELKKALINGLLDQGVNVIDIGLCSSPTFYFGVSNYDYDGGIQVTASHNPTQWNGFKLTKRQAVCIGNTSGMNEIKTICEKNQFTEPIEKGVLSIKENVLNDQIEHDLKFSNISKIKPLKVVVDTANAMGSLYIEALFDKIPCELIKMNFELDGRFPNHEADPSKDENNKQLQEKVIKEKADLGIAIDGDGDRVFFIDEKGKTVPPYIIRGILSQIFLREHPNSIICYDIRPGKITVDMIKQARGIPVRTNVGHTLIKEKMRKVGAVFGGESSGHFFLKLDKGIYEVPVIVILKLLEEFSQSNKKISEYIAPYDKYYHSGEINSIVDDKQGKMKQLEEKYKATAKHIDWFDGITVEYDDWWFNVRPSNTESKLRLNIESVSKELMEQKRDEILGIIRN